MRVLFVLFACMWCHFGAAQGIKISPSNPGPPQPSAVLELQSTQQGFLPPRLSTAQRNAIVSPALGLVIFNTDKDCIEFYTQSQGWYSPCIGLPVVTTSAASQISAYAFSIGGQVVSDGGAAVSQRGICFGLNPNPTLADSLRISGAGVGTFTGLAAFPLSPNTTYYVRAFATNIAGTAYGNQVQVTTTSPVRVSFQNPGQTSWTAPAMYIRVLAIGGGGGGGGNDGPVGGGGGSGAAAAAGIPVTVGQVYSIGVGGGGLGGNSSCGGPNGNGGAGGANGGGNGGNAGTSPCSGGGGGGGGWSGIFSGSTYWLVAGGGAGGGGSNEGTANDVAAPGGGSQPNGHTGNPSGGNGAPFSGDGGGGGGGGGGYFGGNGQSNLTGGGSASGGGNHAAPNVNPTFWNGNAGGIDGNGGAGGASTSVSVASLFSYLNNSGGGGNGGTSQAGDPGVRGEVIILY
jgi:hypothetical protein